MYKNYKSTENDDQASSSSNSDRKNDKAPKYDMDEIFKKCTNYNPRKSFSDKIGNAVKKFTDNFTGDKK